MWKEAVVAELRIAKVYCTGMFGGSEENTKAFGIGPRYEAGPLEDEGRMLTAGPRRSFSW